MCKFVKKTKGAISLFLALLLLPLMSLASIFVDMSRLNLAQSMAASAGDLTLNTALTNYDSELKTLYGLFATAQNMDEMMEGLEDYYRQSIEAAGVDSYYAEDFAKNLVNSVKEATGVDDLMNIQLGGLEVEIPQGAHLGNPAIMKNQIVEFMKYRAPVNLGMGLIDALSSMKNMTKQMDVVEKKNAFYKDHQSMLGNIESAWKSIQTYQYKDATTISFPVGTSEKTYIAIQKGVLGSKYQQWADKKVIDLAVKYVYNSQGYGNTITNNSAKFLYKIETVYKCKECVTEYSSKRNCTSCGKATEECWKIAYGTATCDEVKSHYSDDETVNANNVLEDLNAALRAQKIWKKQMNSALYDAIMGNGAKNEGSDARKIYLVSWFNKEGTSILKAGKDYLQCLVKLKAAAELCSEKELTTTYVRNVGGDYPVEMVSSGDTLKKHVDDQLKNLTMSGPEGFNMFNELVGRVYAYWIDTNDTVEEARSTVVKVVTDSRDAAVAFEKKINEKIGNLNTAISYLQEAKDMLDGKSGTYSSNKNAWSSSAEKLGEGDTMGQHDLDELSNLDSVVTAGTVGDLIDRLNAAKKSLEAVLKQIAEFKIAGTSWKDLPEGELDYKDVLDLLSAWNGQINKINKNGTATAGDTGVIKGPENDNAYNGVISEITATLKKVDIKTKWDQDKDPNLAPNSPKLYAWMYNNYYNPDMDYSDTTLKTADTGAAKDAATTIEKSKAEGHKDASSVSGSGGTNVNNSMQPYLDAENGLPSTRWKGEKAELAKAEIMGSADEMMASKENDNFLNTIMNLAVNMGRDLRDSLYISEYIMTMFSYDTLEAEIFDQNNTDSNRSYEAFYEKVEDKWKAKEAYADYAGMMMTQTKVPITPDMNYLYGEEVEYILYGTAGSTGVYATIFALRFGMNTVYAFMDAEINNVTLSAATALFGTPPLTPLIPVAKIAMTIALALAESGWDLNELSKGKAIPLMKNKDTWVMKPTGIAKEVKEEAMTIAKNAANKAIDKGYEVLNKALNATSEEMDAIIKSGEEGIGQLADAAMASAIGSLENHANVALQKAVELCNQVNQEYMTTLPDATDTKNFPGDPKEKAELVRTRLQEWMDSQVGDTAVIKEVKQIAVNYLKKSGQIEALLSAIEKQATSGTPTNYLNDKLKTISQEISIKIDDATTKVGSALKGMKDSMVSDLSAAAKEGADKLKETLSNKLDDCFGKVSTSDTAVKGASSGVVSSLLSWRYSDYLRIFVVVGLLSNEELMLLRTADVIERNMQHKNNEEALVTSTETVTKSRFFGLIKYKQEKQVTSISDDAFTLSKSYTYVKVDAQIQVKPLFMTLPFMADTVENQLTGTNWYEFTATSILGY